MQVVVNGATRAVAGAYPRSAGRIALPALGILAAAALIAPFALRD